MIARKDESRFESEFESENESGFGRENESESESESGFGRENESESESEFWSESENDSKPRFDSLVAPMNPSKWETRFSVIDRLQHNGGTETDEVYFFHKYRSLIIAIGKNKNLSDDDIKELITSVFADVFKEFSEIRAGKRPEIRLGPQDNGRFYHFKSWLTAIIQKKIYDIYREYARRQKVDATLYKMRLKADPGIKALWHQFLLREALQELRDSLTATQFRVFYQVKMKGKKGPQVAAVYDLTPNNVNQICSRAMKTLRQNIESLMEDHPYEQYAEAELCRYIDEIDRKFQELEDQFPEE